MTSHGRREADAGGRALPRTAGLHRSHATAVECRGPDALARHYACTRDAATLTALVELCAPLVLGTASAYRTPGLRDDLVQEGFLGLLRAIDRYDPSRGTPFVAFARYFIRGGISHYVRDHRWILRPPRSAKRPPRTLSLDAERAGGPERESPPALGPVRREDTCWDDRVVLIDALMALGPLPRAVVFYSHFVGLTQVEVAGRIGISQKHVSRLLAGALIRLRSVLACGGETAGRPTPRPPRSAPSDPGRP
ncbi:MAG: sigma-70 family RNA polymerase sigma factor [bacterium]